MKQTERCDQSTSTIALAKPCVLCNVNEPTKECVSHHLVMQQICNYVRILSAKLQFAKWSSIVSNQLAPKIIFAPEIGSK